MAPSTNLDILQTMLLTWTDEEVRMAWTMVAEEGEQRRAAKTKRMKSTLKAGDKVSWSGGKKQGVIVRTKYKKAIVSECGMEHNWDIPFSMLSKQE
jgi:hypothetical protein